MLNALASSFILPMSDVKPCTASIVSMQWSEEWSVKITFVSRERLDREKEQALADSEEYLDRIRKNNLGDEQPDDPRYLRTLLQRFITLYHVDANLPPEQLVNVIRSAEVPDNIAEKLGKTAEPRNRDMAGMAKVIEKYLSTKDVLWTIVDSCQIRGPFDGWHDRLHLVDLPGTNDTDPHRTKITK